MHTTIGMMNRYMSALALSFALLAFCAGSVWAQDLTGGTGGEGGGEGWERMMDGGTGGEGGGEGWERPVDVSFDIRGTLEQPTRPALLGTYPNPFNPETTIRFEVPAAQQVRLSVFNVLGQQVKVLVDGRVEAGTQEVRFEAYGLPSGTYFTRLETAAGISTSTMVLAK